MMKNSALDTSGWREFKLSDLFDIQTTKKKFNATDVKFGGKFPYVARGDKNNGIKGYINQDIAYLNSGNTISFGQDTATMFYQKNPYFTGDKIKILIFNEKKFNYTFNEFIALYMITMLKIAFVNFNWGSSSYEVGILKNMTFKLPVDSQGNIDWHFMEESIKKTKAELEKILQSYHSLKLLATNGGGAIPLNRLLHYKSSCLTESTKDILALPQYDILPCHSEGVRSTTEESKTMQNLSSQEQDSLEQAFLCEGIMQIAQNLIEKLDTSKWQEFKLTSLFTYKRGTRLTKNNRIKGQYPLVTAGEYNKGVKEYISNENQIIFSNAITIDMFCNAFVHIDEFCCDDNVLVLNAIEPMSKETLLFISVIINKDKEKWGYGRQYRQNSLEKHSILLPADSHNNPDFAFMESFIKEIEAQHTQKILAYYQALKRGGGGNTSFILKEYLVYQTTSQSFLDSQEQNFLNEALMSLTQKLLKSLDTSKWVEFKIGDLFEVKSNPQLNKNSFEFCEDGEYPYFTRTVYNNGILGYVKYLDEKHKIKGNVIAVGLIAMQFFYMEKDFYAGQFTKSIYPKFENFNRYIALYFTALFNANKNKYLKNFVVKDFEKDFTNTVIILPIDSKNKPDFVFMESFIKAIEKEHSQKLLAYYKSIKDSNGGALSFKLGEYLRFYESYKDSKKIESVIASESKQSIKDISHLLNMTKGSHSEALAEESKNTTTQAHTTQLQWQEFRIGDLFEIKPTKAYKMTNSTLFATSGNTPVVTNSSLNNGVSGYVNLEPTEKGGMITYSDTTTSEGIFYQPKDFVGYSHVQGLYPLKYQDKWSKNALLYFVCAFRKTAFGRFDYGNKFNRNIAKEMKVLLPIYPNGDIAFEYMESFIKALQKEVIKSVNLWNEKELKATKEMIHKS